MKILSDYDVEFVKDDGKTDKENEMQKRRLMAIEKELNGCGWTNKANEFTKEFFIQGDPKPTNTKTRDGAIKMTSEIICRIDWCSEEVGLFFFVFFSLSSFLTFSPGERAQTNFSHVFTHHLQLLLDKKKVFFIGNHDVLLAIQ